MTFLVLSVLPAPDSPLKGGQERTMGVWRRSIRDQDTLILALFTHVNPGTLSHGEYVWRVFITALSPILMNDSVGVKRKSLIWVDGN